MARKVVVLSGAVSSGKSTLAHQLCERFDARRVSTHEVLVSRLKSGVEPTRRSLQALGDKLDRETKGRWVADAVTREADDNTTHDIIVVDAVRIKPQIDRLREAFGRRLVHVHLTAPPLQLRRRYAIRSRRSRGGELASYDKVRANPTEASIENLGTDADVVIDTDCCTKEDVFVRATCHLGLNGRDTGALVDVIVGGQYGSEGKGHVAHYLAPAYDFLMRVGGPNAGHKVIWPHGGTFTHRQLPSGTLATEARLLIGPGAVVDVPTLMKEVAACQVDGERLAIDPQAMIIEEADRRAERSLVKAIGSTGQGVGAATARRIRRTGKVRLAKDIPALKPYLHRVSDVLEDGFARGQRVLLEGTQGTALSLYHGRYPHVTSRDTTVSGCLAEAGIPPGRVRKVVMVCRTYPIRVMSPEGASSGPMRQELTWRAISRRSGLDLQELKRVEKGSVSHKQRRVAEFDWALLRQAALINGPTDIALTFADYLNKLNREARRFEQLAEATIEFIQEVERVAAARVSLISTAFHPRSIIDRRSW